MKNLYYNVALPSRILVSGEVDNEVWSFIDQRCESVDAWGFLPGNLAVTVEVQDLVGREILNRVNK